MHCVNDEPSREYWNQLALAAAVVLNTKLPYALDMVWSGPTAMPGLPGGGVISNQVVVAAGYSPPPLATHADTSAARRRSVWYTPWLTSGMTTYASRTADDVAGSGIHAPPSMLYSRPLSLPVASRGGLVQVNARDPNVTG